MAAALVVAQFDPDDPAATSEALKNFFEARRIAWQWDTLETTYDATSYGALEMEVEGPENEVVAFVERCVEEDVRVHAVREDDETSFRLV